MGLNEAYKSTRRHILMLQPIPDTEDVFNMVAQEESHKNIKPSMRVDMAFQNSGPSYLSYNIPQDNAAYAVAFQSNHFSPKPILLTVGELVIRFRSATSFTVTLRIISYIKGLQILLLVAKLRTLKHHSFHHKISFNSLNLLDLLSMQMQS